MKPLIFLQLNEINFDVVKSYIEKWDSLPAFKRLLSEFNFVETYCEAQDEQQEPWIQWVSAHTGKTYEQHKVFRLGDVVTAPESLTQIFEILEQGGLKVGAISPMNARNRLSNPAYYIPDPWTDTPPDNSKFSKRLTSMMRQSVNDNSANKLTASSILTLIESVFRSFELKGSITLVKHVASAVKNKWYRSLVLDQLLHLVHVALWKKHKPDVSFVFLNAGAHIQHHYFLNSSVLTSDVKNPSWYVPQDADPIYDMLKAYDQILGSYLKLVGCGTQLLVATGLSQVPYQEVKFFYRLIDHLQFLALIGISPSHVLPRMTRDFEIFFDDLKEAQRAKFVLEGLVMQRDGIAIFGVVELREKSIFATLTYSREIFDTDNLINGSQVLDDFGQLVVFVAIKNGTHCPKGYAFITSSSVGVTHKSPAHVAELFNITKELCL